MENDSILFRTALESDAEQLLEIYAPYVKNTAISFEYDVPSVEEFKQRIKNVLIKYPYIVAEKDGQIIGYVYASAFKSREAYKYSVETSLYIKKDCRRLGLGRKLYSLLEKVLFAQGVLNVNACITYTEKESPYLTNDSMHFHDHQGYRLVGRFTKCGYKFGCWFDMIWMEKLLDVNNERSNNPQNFLPYSEVKDLFSL